MTAYTDQANTLGATQVYGVDFASGGWADESGNGLHLTRVGATTEAGPGDGLDTALSCDGVDDYAFRADEAALEIGATHTVCYWVKRNGVITSFAHEVGKANDSWHTRDRSDGHEWNINGGNSIIQEDVGGTAWHFVVIRQDDGANTRVLRSYGTDGVQLAAEETGTSVGTPNTVVWDFSVGAQDHDGYRRFYEGAFAGLAIFDGIALTDQQIDDLLDSTFAAGGVSQAIGQAVDTSTAQPVTAPGVSQLIGQSVATSTAQAVAASKTQAIGQALETDTAQAVTVVKAVQIGQALESDLAQAVASTKAVQVGQVSETDTAQAVAAVKAHLIGLVSESDTAQPVSAVKTVAVGQVVETDTAQPVAESGQVSQQVGQASETDLAQPLAASKIQSIGQAVEVDVAQSIASTNVVQIGQASESDIAQAVTTAKAFLIGQATETDLALAVTAAGGLTVVHIEGRTYAFFTDHGASTADFTDRGFATATLEASESEVS